jgi:hypothetical protein
MSDLTPRILELVARLKGETAAPPPPIPSAAPETPGRSGPAEVARVLGLPLAQLDAVLRVAVPWLDVPLWFVPDEAEAAALVAAGDATRGTVWTRQELLDLLAVPGISKEGARTVARAKLAFGGEVAGVADRRPRRAALGTGGQTPP